MKTIKLLLAIVTATTLNLKFGTLNCKAQTSVPAGNVSGTWTLAGSPYNIQGSIQILDGTTLTIQPGVTVDFQGTYKLNVQGRLLAIGTVADTIIFTATNTTNGWRGIRFDNTPTTNDTSKIVYCKLQYGKAAGFSNDNGGALYFNNFSKAIIFNCSISNCAANTFGGGIYCYGSSPIISSSTISNNTAYFGGGGIHLDGSSPSVFNNIISNNSASNGGGIRCNSGANPNITKNIISNNSASNYGGGIYCNNNNGSIINNIISNNSSSLGGGIAFDGNSTTTTTNNTISYNSATNGGALYLDNNSIPIFLNTILWGNSASTSGSQVFLNSEVTDPNFYYCDIQGGSAGFELNGNSYTGTYQNNIDTDPLFVSPSGGSGNGFDGVTADWSLQNNSPCINTGDPNGIYASTDKAGNARVTVCRIDMGAYEYQNGIPFTATISQTQQILCYDDSTASATINVTGGTPTYTYLWSDGQANAIATGLGAGVHTVTVTETSYACSITKTITINQPAAALSLTQFSSHPICTNNNGIAGVISNGGTPPYTYLWSTNNNNTTDTISNLLAGTYSVTVTDTNGCSILDSVTLVTEFPSLSLVSFFTNASCYNNDGSASIIPNGGAEPYSYLWSNDSISQSLSSIGNGTYSVAVTDTNGCFVSETFIINNSIAPISIPICMVTVDSSSTKNVIVWEKPTDAPIGSFSIYREIASVYTFVGSVPYDEVSEFTDNANGINPNTTSYKYKLLVLDTCGNESLLSDIHRTIHVQLSVAFPQGVNLNWNDYAGFTFSQYRILRDDLGNGNWQVIDSVSFGTTTYTSTDVLPNAQYIVEATRPTSCVSTRQSGTTRNSSKSNTASQTTGVNEVLNDLSLIISPNPSNGKLAVELSNSGFSNNNKFALKIYNVLGEQVYLSELKQLTRNEIDLSNVPKGIYFVNVYNGDKIYTRKIVKQ